MRVAAIQYPLQRVRNFSDFAAEVTHYVEVAADYQADFVLFPEHFSLQLLSRFPQKLDGEASIGELTRHTPELQELFQRLAQSHGLTIVGGSHPTRQPDGRIENLCFVALPDGSLRVQSKIHATPNERKVWNIQGGSDLQVIHTPQATIGVLICYDVEFPELARQLVDQGVEVLFVPFCTDDRQGYLRVRYCAQARAVENQCYVVMAGSGGHLRGVTNMDIQYSQSCILTPCDLPFTRDGILCEATPNADQVLVGQLDLEVLREFRQSGTVQNLKDRRLDLYRTEWRAAAGRGLSESE